MRSTAANPSPRRRVVITGTGALTCLGRNVEETFAAARQGKSGVRAIARFDATNLPAGAAGEVDDSSMPEVSAVPESLRKFSFPALEMICAAAVEAARQAGLDDVTDRERIGCMVGCHGADPPLDQIRLLNSTADSEGDPDTREALRRGGFDLRQFYRREPDITTAVVADRIGCLGPTLSMVSACAAGAQAIGEAFRAIRRNRADAMLCGGCDAKLTYPGYIGFVLLKALCERYRSPETASRPFDRRRNGFVMSEGAAALVIEELGHARARGATILGEVLGYGDSADAYRITDVHPQGEGAILAMKNALADAGVSPQDVHYVNAHGTSTKQNDAVESNGIRAVFGDHADRLPVSSNKSMMGHAIAAAGAIEAILTLVGMRESTLLPTINYESPDPKCPLPDYVPNQAREVEHRLAISNSFGFGGQNACLCLAAFDHERE